MSALRFLPRMIRRSTSASTKNDALPAALFALLLVTAAHASDGAILILNSYHLGYTWSDHETAGIMEELHASDARNYLEYLDCKNFPRLAHFPVMVEYLRQKYAGRNIAVLLTEDNPALNFALEYRAQLFPNAAIVFCGVNDFMPEMLRAQRRVTGIPEVLDIQGTMDLALHLHPDAKTVFVIHDYTATGLALRHEMESMAPRYAAQVRCEYAPDEAFSDLLNRLETLKSDTVVLILSYATDQRGTVLEHAELTKRLAARCARPMYAVHEARLGHGIVGGSLLRGIVHGRNAAGIALEVLRGANPDDIPIAPQHEARLMADYEQLARFGVASTALPPDVTLINRPDSFFDKYWRLTAGTMVVLGVLTLATIVMGMNIRHRRRAEEALRESETRFRGLFENSISCVALHEIVTDADGRLIDGIFLAVNPAFERETGKSADAVMGRRISEILPSAAQAGLIERCGEAALSGQPNRFEQYIPELDRYYDFQAYSPSSRQYAVVFRDITDRKRAEMDVAQLAKFPSENPNPVLRISGNGTVLYANAAGTALLSDRETQDGKPTGEYLRDRAMEMLAAQHTLEEDIKASERIYTITYVPLTASKYVNLYGRDITERKRAEEALRESETRYRSLFENMRNGFAYCRMLYEQDRPSDFVYLAVNDAFGRLTGLNDVVGRRVSEVIPGIRQSDPELFERYGRVARTGVPESFEFYLTALKQWFVTSVYRPAQDHFVVVFDVITERKLAEENLRQTKERLELALRASNAGTWEWEIDSGRIEWNDKLFELFGLDPATNTASFDVWRSIMHPDDLPAAEDRIRRALENRTTLASEYRVRLRDGRTRWIHALGEGTYDDAGRATRMAGLCLDITERKQADEALRRSEAILNETGRIARIGGWEHDLDARRATWTKALYDIIGITSETVPGPDEHLNYYPPESRATLEKAYNTAIETGKPFDIEVQCTTTSGKPIWARVLGRPEFRDGRCVKLRGTFQDISDRKHVAGALRESEERYSTLVETASDAIFIADPNTGLILDANRRGEELLGRPREEIIGIHHLQIHPPDELERAKAAFADAVKERGRLITDLHALHKDGSRIPVEINSGAVVKAGDRMVFFGIFRDVSERKNLERQLRESQKMEAVGQLAGGIAHDFNNLLQTIFGYTELLQSSLAENHAALDALKQVTEAATQAVGVTRGLLTFSRRLESEKGPVDLAAVLRKSIHLLQRTLPANIELITEIQDDAPLIARGDETQMQQVIMNLAINARDAMSNGGSLRLSLALSPADNQGTESAQREIRLRVRDSGTGIDPAIRERIFEPFFSTKAAGQGTGLGLAIIHGIVRDHGGRIEVESEPGRGSSFTVTLPLLENVAARLPTPELPPTPHGKGELILVAEDDENVRRIVKAALKGLSYAVVEVGDGEALLAAYQEHAAQLRLIISDIEMPKCSGVEATRRLRSIGVKTPIILITGMIENVDKERLGVETCLLRKPFRVAELGRLAAELCGIDDAAARQA